MSDIKLSKAQKETIKKMREGSYLKLFMRIDFACFSNHDGRIKYKETFNPLYDAGLIVNEPWKYSYADKYVLTELGKTIEL